MDYSRYQERIKENGELRHRDFFQDDDDYKYVYCNRVNGAPMVYCDYTDEALKVANKLLGNSEHLYEIKKMRLVVAKKILRILEIEEIKNREKERLNARSDEA